MQAQFSEIEIESVFKYLVVGVTGVLSIQNPSVSFRVARLPQWGKSPI